MPLAKTLNDLFNLEKLYSIRGQEYFNCKTDDYPPSSPLHRYGADKKTYFLDGYTTRH